MKKTNFLSKEAPLQESLAMMKTVLADVGCETTFSHEKHPLKHCYSVNLASVEAPNHIYSNGKGIVSDASMASALGEYIERLQTNNFFIDFHLPNRKYYPDEIAFEFNGAYLSDELRFMILKGNSQVKSLLITIVITRIKSFPCLLRNDQVGRLSIFRLIF